jgi:transposase
MEVIYPKSAGADVGSRMIYIALPDGKVVRFKTFSEDLQQAVIFLKNSGINQLAMEATGVYWIVFYSLLEQAGIEVHVVNPRMVKHVPGRKSDVQDCQWIQQLFSVGLLRKSFVPEESIRNIRSLIRLRGDHLEMSSAHVNHIQKSLTLMNIRLHEVISQIHGVSGFKVVKAIIDGERDSQKLLLLCDKRIIKNKKEEVLASLKGNYNDVHLFALKQAFEGYNFYQNQIKEVDALLEKHLKNLSKDEEENFLDKKSKPIRHHKPMIESLHSKMLAIFKGKDLTALPGFTDYNLMQLLGEIGVDINPWPTEKHFTSWLGLAPGMNQSGKQNKRSKSGQNTRAGQIFREAAQTILISKNIGLGSFARRIRARKGPRIAIKATARKLAELFYRTMKKGFEYVETGLIAYEKNEAERQMKILSAKMKRLQLQITQLQIIE